MITLALTNFVFFPRDNNGLEDLKKKKRSFPICRVFNSFIFSICQQIAICLTKDFFPTVNKHQISYQLFFFWGPLLESPPSPPTPHTQIYSTAVIPGRPFPFSVVLSFLWNPCPSFLFTHFVGVHLPITFQDRLYGRYILKTLLSLKISLFYFTIV